MYNLQKAKHIFLNFRCFRITSIIMLETLPEELLEAIFMQPSLSASDLVHLKRSSKYLQDIINSYGEKKKGSLWQAKFLKMYECIMII